MPPVRVSLSLPSFSLQGLVDLLPATAKNVLTAVGAFVALKMAYNTLGFSLQVFFPGYNLLKRYQVRRCS